MHWTFSLLIFFKFLTLLPLIIKILLISIFVRLLSFSQHTRLQVAIAETCS